MTEDTSMIKLDALLGTPLNQAPFPFLVIDNLLNEEYAAAILNDFPEISARGSFPPEQLECGESFRRLIEELESDAFRAAVEEKLSINLKGRPTMITVRGRTGERDGRIHADTQSKLVTVLLYFNPVWETETGRLRVLKDSKQLDDYVVEITPTFGKCIIFKVTDNCWHGHKPFVGERKALQLNYVRDETARSHHLRRHQLTAKLKKMRRWFGKNEN
ncbi:MAG TPA: 2OG-Fe(II) oxygenase [Pyrinomonadaceae bacterium]|nr:2OG-Fe(II) oxygenase [Pyrinomonadaceae bacterium]